MWNSCCKKRNTSFIFCMEHNLITWFLHQKTPYHLETVPKITRRQCLTRCKATVWHAGRDQMACKRNLTQLQQKTRCCGVACVTGLQHLLSTAGFIFRLPETRGPKDSPPSTQLFHTPISWHVIMYCIGKMAYECRLEFPVPQALSSGQFCIFLYNWFRKTEVISFLCLSEGLLIFPECDSM